MRCARTHCEMFLFLCLDVHSHQLWKHACVFAHHVVSSTLSQLMFTLDLWGSSAIVSAIHQRDEGACTILDPTANCPVRET